MAKKESVKKTEETEEKEEFFEEKKPKKEKNEKSLASRITNIVLWIVLLVWMAICLFDFYKVHQEEDPVFCLSKETTTYSDGTVDSCLGLGYKVYRYKRNCFNAIEFGPFWSKDRSLKETNCN